MRCLLLASIAAALLLVACGGDDSDGGESRNGPRDAATTADRPRNGPSDTATTAKRPRKAQFIKRVDAICTKTHERVKALREPTGKSSPKEQEEYVEKVAQATDDASNELQRLKRPPGDNSAIDEYLKLGREQIRIMRRLGEAFGDRETARAMALNDALGSRGRRRKGLARGYGFKVCSSEDK